MAQGVKTGGRDWKPGQSGNPRGRPRKGESMRELVREYLAGSQEVATGSGKRRRVVIVQRKQLLIHAIFEAAVKGSVPAQRLLLSYAGIPVMPVLNRK